MYELNVWQLVLHFTDHFEPTEDGHKNVHGCLLAAVEKCQLCLRDMYLKKHYYVFCICVSLND
jgi:hypothetical protein